MVGDVLATNGAMLALAQDLGFRVQRHADGGAQVLQVQFELSAQVALQMAPQMAPQMTPQTAAQAAAVLAY
jgi:hypothetical protein